MQFVLQKEENESKPMQPMQMYFNPTEYMKKIKISPMCYITKTVKTLNELKPLLKEYKRRWFEMSDQFKRFFYMPHENIHKII